MHRLAETAVSVTLSFRLTVIDSFTLSAVLGPRIVTFEQKEEKEKSHRLVVSPLSSGGFSHFLLFSHL